MKKENVQVTRQELYALKFIANAIVKTVNSILVDYELAAGEAVSLCEAERATLFGDSISPFENAFVIKSCLLIPHPTLVSHFIICRGSTLPTSVAASCSPAAASFLKSVFADNSLVFASDGLVLQPITLLASSKSFLANVCVGSSVSGSLYIPD